MALMLSEWVRRLGAFAAMRITASWFGSLHPPNTRMWHETFVHHTRAPLELRHPDHSKCAVVLGAIKAKPVGGRPTGRPALTAPARAGDVGCVGRGEETGCP